jgi:uncharacterized membrane protein YidH (DUF202 family)
MIPPLPLAVSIIFVVGGAICLFGAERMCRFAANQSRWNWHRQLVLHKANVWLVRAVGLVAVLWGAVAIISN